MLSYEQLLARIGELPRSDTSRKRVINWATDAHVVGISRTHQNRIEMFLAGPKLVPASRTIREAIEHQPWWHQAAQDAAFEANRLLLPAAGHSDQVAAFICTELLRSGADDNLETAFSKTEPIIELAIERLRISDGAFLGLAGELLLINAICERVDQSDVTSVVESWAGWQQSLRDFTWGAIGVEVKTTTRTTSTHRIHGMHQIELSEYDDTSETGETDLYFVSIGLQPTDPHENSFTVPSLVDRIIDRLRVAGRQDVVDTFLAHVREYGSRSGFGYDHQTMSDDAAFIRSFAVTFVRAYDMTDENVAVLRHKDVVDRRHVDTNSITYSVELPSQVSGDLNPIVGLNQTALAILGATSFHQSGRSESP